MEIEEEDYIEFLGDIGHPKGERLEEEDLDTEIDIYDDLEMYLNPIPVCDVCGIELKYRECPNNCQEGRILISDGSIFSQEICPACNGAGSYWICPNVGEHPCEWHLINDDTDAWKSSCGDAWIFEDGTPEDNHMNYCPFCGRHLKQRVSDTSLIFPGSEGE